MGRGSQTFRKRQREMKLREKAQLKRERRVQRRNEKKALLAADPLMTSSIESDPIEAGPEAGSPAAESADSVRNEPGEPGI